MSLRAFPRIQLLKYAKVVSIRDLQKKEHRQMEVAYKEKENKLDLIASKTTTKDKVLNDFYICFGDLRSVIFSALTVIVSGYHGPHLYETAYLIDRCCVF